MRKEVLFAILAGGLFGLIIAFGIWKANSSLNNKKKAEAEVSQSSSESEMPSPSPSSYSITLVSPDNLEVVTVSPVKISGATKPNAYLSISGELDDYVLNADGAGAFEKEIELSPGINQIAISAYDSGGFKSEKDLTLVYSTEFEKE